MNKTFAWAVAYICLGSLSAFGKSDPPEETVEIKCLIPEAKIAEFSKRIRLDSKESFTRVVCFFDTENLSLFQHEPKIILRSRYDSSGGTDTTVKVRNAELGESGSECEYDEVLGKDKVLSCSVTESGEKKSLIKKANSSKKIKPIFSKAQRLLLKETFGDLDWTGLRPYGPVKDIKVWKKIKVSGGPRLTVERWTLPARSTEPERIIFEVSTKVPLADEKEVSQWMAGLVSFAADGGDQESETKTRIVLEYFKGGPK